MMSLDLDPDCPPLMTRESSAQSSELSLTTPPGDDHRTDGLLPVKRLFLTDINLSPEALDQKYSDTVKVLVPTDIDNAIVSQVEDAVVEDPIAVPNPDIPSRTNIPSRNTSLDSLPENIYSEPSSQSNDAIPGISPRKSAQQLIKQFEGLRVESSGSSIKSDIGPSRPSKVVTLRRTHSDSPLNADRIVNEFSDVKASKLSQSSTLPHISEDEETISNAELTPTISPLTMTASVTSAVSTSPPSLYPDIERAASATSSVSTSPPTLFADLYRTASATSALSTSPPVFYTDLDQEIPPPVRLSFSQSEVIERHPTRNPLKNLYGLFKKRNDIDFKSNKYRPRNVIPASDSSDGGDITPTATESCSTGASATALEGAVLRVGSLRYLQGDQSWGFRRVTLTDRMLCLEASTQALEDNASRGPQRCLYNIRDFQDIRSLSSKEASSLPKSGSDETQVLEISFQNGRAEFIGANSVTERGAWISSFWDAILACRDGTSPRHAPIASEDLGSDSDWVDLQITSKRTLSLVNVPEVPPIQSTAPTEKSLPTPPFSMFQNDNSFPGRSHPFPAVSSESVRNAADRFQLSTTYPESFQGSTLYLNQPSTRLDGGETYVQSSLSTSDASGSTLYPESNHGNFNTVRKSAMEFLEASPSKYFQGNKMPSPQRAPLPRSFFNEPPSVRINTASPDPIPQIRDAAALNRLGTLRSVATAWSCDSAILPDGDNANGYTGCDVEIAAPQPLHTVELTSDPVSEVSTSNTSGLGLQMHVPAPQQKNHDPPTTTTSETPTDNGIGLLPESIEVRNPVIRPHATAVQPSHQGPPSITSEAPANNATYGLPQVAERRVLHEPVVVLSQLEDLKNPHNDSLDGDSTQVAGDLKPATMTLRNEAPHTNSHKDSSVIQTILDKLDLMRASDSSGQHSSTSMLAKIEEVGNATKNLLPEILKRLETLSVQEKPLPPPGIDLDPILEKLEALQAQISPNEAKTEEDQEQPEGVNTRLDDIVSTLKEMSKKIESPAVLSDVSSDSQKYYQDVLDKIGELMVAFKEEQARSTAIEQKQQEFAIYLGELNMWLETVVKSGGGEMHTIATGVKSLVHEMLDTPNTQAQGSDANASAQRKRGFIGEMKGFMDNHNARTRHLEDKLGEFLKRSGSPDTEGNSESSSTLFDKQREEFKTITEEMTRKLRSEIRGEQTKFIESMRDATNLHVQRQMSEIRNAVLAEISKVAREVSREELKRSDIRSEVKELMAVLKQGENSHCRVAGIGLGVPTSQIRQGSTRRQT